MIERLTEITPGPFTRLAVGSNHVCALREDGSPFCQGENYAKQASPPPTKFTQIAAGLKHSCGITRAGRIERWGVGAPGERLTAPDGEFLAIAIRRRNSCALRLNRSPVCWRTPDNLSRGDTPVGIAEAFGGAKFDANRDIFPWPSGGIAIVNHAGVISARRDSPDAPPPQTILDITAAVVSSGHGGRLSAALDPQFQDFPFLYIWYTTTSDADNLLGEAAPRYVGRLARFRVENDVAVKNSELPILEIPLPNRWHMGGAVRFGEDGMLYLGIGDNETPDAAQSLNNLRGKIIRIDARGANAERPYRVPPTTPLFTPPARSPKYGHTACETPGAWH